MVSIQAYNLFQNLWKSPFWISKTEGEIIIQIKQSSLVLHCWNSSKLAGRIPSTRAGINSLFNSISILQVSFSLSPFLCLLLLSLFHIFDHICFNQFTRGNFCMCVCRGFRSRKPKKPFNYYVKNAKASLSIVYIINYVKNAKAS